MKVRITITAIFMLLFSVMSFAQSNTLTGKVIDGENAPIPGVAVKIVGTSTGAYTDDSGNYSVKVNKGDSIRFSFIGFATQTIAYTGQLSLDVNLSETTFDEVVVVAYGTQKKSHNTSLLIRSLNEVNISDRVRSLTAIIKGWPNFFVYSKFNLLKSANSSFEH